MFPLVGSSTRCACTLNTFDTRHYGYLNAILVCAFISLVLLVGGAWALSIDGSRVIVVFKEGTPLEVQKAVVALSLSTIVHILSLSDSIAVLLPAVNPDLALAILQGDPNVAEVIEDQLTVIDGTTCIDPASPPFPEAYGWGLERERLPTGP